MSNSNFIEGKRRRISVRTYLDADLPKRLAITCIRLLKLSKPHTSTIMSTSPCFHVVLSQAQHLSQEPRQSLERRDWDKPFDSVGILMVQRRQS